MPRDASATRDSLVDAGRELFAREGVFSVPLSQVVTHAGQRNESALHYHFGGRQGLLNAIIESHNAPIELRRRSVLDALEDEPRTPGLDELVVAYVEPQAELLATTPGRQFLAIVSQLQDLFDRWNDPSAPTEARRVLELIAQSLDLTSELRHERMTRFLGFVALTLGARARSVERGVEQPLDDETFVSNLIAMSVGALSA
ncbi:MAG: TetR/AcrR family transcriptional regulator [Acidimicrobiia bacterium]|nr:TetR/AcrR family transcriptional regulator [Acidimicrobiia bacterium]